MFGDIKQNLVFGFLNWLEPSGIYSLGGETNSGILIGLSLLNNFMKSSLSSPKILSIGGLTTSGAVKNRSR